MRIYEDAYSAAKRLYKQIMQNYETSVSHEIIANGKKIGKWTNEGNLYTLVVKHYPDAIYQYHSEWLVLQSLDIFIPSLHVGIEYQGIQHYEPVSFFGGNNGFQRTQERDRRKAELCRENGVKLIYWRYDESISASNLKSKLKKAGIVSENQ